MVRLQEQAPRGVHENPYYASDGAVILTAVNSQGIRVGQLRVFTREAYADAMTKLTHLLADVDPMLHATPPWMPTISPSLHPA